MRCVRGLWGYIGPYLLQMGFLDKIRPPRYLSTGSTGSQLAKNTCYRPRGAEMGKCWARTRPGITRDRQARYREG